MLNVKQISEVEKTKQLLIICWSKQIEA